MNGALASEAVFPLSSVSSALYDRDEVGLVISGITVIEEMSCVSREDELHVMARRLSAL